MKPETKQMLRRKIEFVEVAEEALVMLPAVESVNYEVYVNSEKDYVEEFLRFNYHGGNYCVRNCSGNSKAAILQEMGRLANGGFYDDERFYLRISTDPEYVNFWEAIKKKSKK